MKEFLMIFRGGVDPNGPPPSPDQLQHTMKQWQDWIGGIAAQNKLSSSGNKLSLETKMVNPGNVITDGPFADIKETIGGYVIVKADSIDGAADLAKGCPILALNGNVEVRPIETMDEGISL